MTTGEHHRDVLHFGKDQLAVQAGGRISILPLQAVIRLVAEHGEEQDDMGDSTVRFYLQNLRNLIQDSLYGPWTTVVDKIGAAYEDAYHNHKDNLPSANTAKSDASILTDLGLQGTVAWLDWGGPEAAALVPIVLGINYAVSNLSSRPMDKKITLPVADLTPAKFKGSLKHVLDVSFLTILQYVDACIRNTNNVDTIDNGSVRKVNDLLALSPYFYLPPNWKVWDADVISLEYERRLWAAWATSLSKSIGNNVAALEQYNFTKVLERLDVLTKRGSPLDYHFAQIAKSADEAGGKMEKLNIEHFVIILKWAVAYKPLHNYETSIPKAVLKEMAALEGLKATDGMILGHVSTFLMSHYRPMLR